MLRNPTVRWVVVTVVLCALLLASAWFLLISPRRDDAAGLRQQKTEVLAGNQDMLVKIEQLRAQSAKLPERLGDLAGLEDQLPPSSRMPALIRALDLMATTSGVTLTGVTPGAAQVGLPSSVGATSPTGSPTTTTSAASGLGRLVAGPVTSTTASVAIPGSTLVSIPVVVTVTGGYFQVAMFVKKMQMSMHRAFLISSIEEGVSKSAGGSGASSTDTGTTTTTTTTTTDTATATTTGSDDAGEGLIDATITGVVFVLPPAVVPTVTTTEPSYDAGIGSATTTTTPATTTTGGTP